jgi:hypothetical protein
MGPSSKNWPLPIPMINTNKSCEVQQSSTYAHPRCFTNHNDIIFTEADSAEGPIYLVNCIIKRENNPLLKDTVHMGLSIFRNPESSRDDLMNLTILDVWNRKGEYFLSYDGFMFKGDDRTGKHSITCKWGGKIESTAMTLYEVIGFSTEKFQHKLSMQNEDLVNG